MAMASLTSSLIARKGDARPSAPSPGFGKSLLPHDLKNKGKKPDGKETDMAATLASITSFTDYAKSREETAPRKQRPTVKTVSPATDTALSEDEDGLPHLYNGRVKKTLRLDVETHKDLLALAEKQGKSQQCLMQRAVEALLNDDL